MEQATERTSRIDIDLSGIAWPAVTLGLSLLAAYRIAWGLLWSLTHDYIDFGIFYQSERNLLAGANPYAIAHTNFTPPFGIRLMAPLGWLPLPSAFATWTIIIALAFIATFLLLRRALGDAGLRWSLVGGAFAAAMPVQHTFIAGQVSAVLGLGLVYVWTQDRAGKPLSWWLAPVLIWKPMAGLLVFRRAAPRLIIPAVVLLGGSLLIDGPDSWASWIGLLLKRTAPDGWPTSADVWQVVARVGGPTWLAPVLAVLVISVTLWRMRSVSRDAWWLLSLSSGLLACPKGWIYYGVWLMPMGLAVWVNGSNRQRRLLEVALLLVLVPISPFDFQQGTIAALTLGSLYFWSYLAVWLAACLEHKPSAIA